MSSLFHKKRITAIEISNNIIRIAQVEGRNSISYIKSVVLPSETFKDGGIIDPHKISEILKEALKTIPNTPKEVIFGVPDFLCFDKIFVLDKKPNDELLEIELIKLAKSSIPIEFEETHWDYIKQETPIDLNTESILYISTATKIIDDYKTIAQDCGLSIRAIDNNAIAISRVFLPSTGKPATDETASSSTATIVVEGNSPSSTISVFNMKDEFIFSWNIPFTDASNKDNFINIIKTEIEKIIKLVSESYSFKVSNIIMVGDLANIPQITEIIALPSHISIVIGDPSKVFSQQSTLENVSLVQYSTVLGLSLYKENDKTQQKQINFLSRGITKKTSGNSPDAKKEVPKNKDLVKKMFVFIFMVITLGLLCFVVFKYIISPFFIK